MKRIQSLPISLRPREKLLKRGAEALSTEELISVVLVTGTKALAVSQIASRITRLLSKVKTLTPQSLGQFGIGPTKAAQVLAALELGKRIQGKRNITFSSPGQVFAHAYEIINQQKEILLCFYLNARGDLLKKETVVMGSLNRANVLPREIFSLIKELPVAGIILVHNHPSGVLEPSKEDLLFTKRIKAAGDLLGVKLLDHLIVSPKGWKQIKI